MPIKRVKEDLKSEEREVYRLLKNEEVRFKDFLDLSSAFPMEQPIEETGIYDWTHSVSLCVTKR